MIRNQTILEIKKDERLYQFQLSPESPLGETLDVLSEMRAYVLNRITEVFNQQQTKTEEPPKVDNGDQQ